MPAFYAICLGINAAPGTAPLAFPELDARRVHVRLQARGFRSVLLVGSYASQTNLLAKLSAVGQVAVPGDLVVLYFSGHGRATANQATPGAPVPDETADDEVFRLWDAELLDDVIAAQVARLDCRVVMIIDSCRAAGLLDVEAVQGRAPGNWVQLLAACEETGTSWGHGETGSFFTTALLEVLDRSTPPETYREWFERAVSPDVMARQPLQRPVYFSSSPDPIPLALGAPVPRLDLSDVQAHVLFGFSHLPRHWLYFFRITDARAFAGAITTQLEPTSAEQYRERPGRGVALALAHRGLQKLRAPGLEQLGAAPGSGAPSSFRADCIGRAIALGDPRTGPGRPESWKVGGAYEEQRPDGVLIMACADQDAWRPEQSVAFLSQAGTEEVFSEHGSWPAMAREHFGFLDGLSKPGVGAWPSSEQAHAGVVPSSATSVHPLDSLLLTAPAMGLEWARHGSFLVYRRLAQDMATLQRELAGVAARRGLSDEAARALVERVMGRRKDGSSLATAVVDLELGGDGEAFEYLDEACPVSAHVRKCNPRRFEATLRGEPTPVLFRRGVLFSADGTAATPALEMGLHFMCYQASLEQQFEHVIRHWANAADFPRSASGVDALIGAALETVNGPLRSVTLGADPELLAPFVIPTGGGYFFSPSLSGLRQLGQAYLDATPPG